MFDLQRFELTGTESDAAFSCVIGSETKYGKADEFTTANVENATEITLLADVTMNAEVTLSAATCDFDLGGNTLSYPNASGNVSALVINNGANVTMTNGKVTYHSNNSAGNDYYAVYVKGVLNLGNTTDDSTKPLEITASGITSNMFIDGGTLNVNNNVTITQDQAGAYAIVYNWDNNVTSHCNINGGTVISHSTATNPSYGAIFFAGKESTFNMTSGRVNYDGTSYCTISTDYLKDGSFTLTGGTIENTHTSSRTAGALELYKVKNANITGGTISSTSGYAVLAYQSATIGGTANIEGGNAGIATHYNSNMGGNITIEGEANVSGGTTGILNRDNSTINVNGGTVTGGTNAISIANGGGNPATGKVNITGGEVNGNVSNTATGASSTKITGGEINGNVTTDNTSGTTEISGGEISGNVTNTSGTTQVMGGTVKGTVQQGLVADGYEQDSNGVVKAKASWETTATANQYAYVLQTATPTTIATATYTGDSLNNLRADTEYRLLGVPNDATSFAFAEGVPDSIKNNYSLAKYNIADGAVTIEPQTNTGFKIIGKTFVDNATTLTTNDTSGYGITVDAAANSLVNISGGGGKDSLVAGNRATTLDGGANDDTLVGGTGADSLKGGIGNDYFYYSAGKDTIADYDAGDTVKTTLEAITDGSQLTSLTSGGFELKFSNANVLTFQNPDAIVSLQSSNGTYHYTSTAISLNGGVTLGTSFNGATFDGSSYTTIDASAVSSATGGINITGNSNSANYIVGSDYVVTSITGGAGSDSLYAGTKGASLNGGAGDDYYFGGTGKDTFAYTGGNDEITSYGTGDIVNVVGAELTIPTTFDSISYGGSDYVIGFSDADSLTFKATSSFSITDGNATYSYNALKSIAKGEEAITLGPSYTSNFNGANTSYVTIDASETAKALRITGNSDNNYLVASSLFGGTLLGGDGADSLVAGSIGAYLNGQDGADSLVGGAGADTFAYTGGADSISGYGDGDLVSVAAGIDVAAASVSTDTNDNLILDFDGEKLTFEGGATSTISLKSGRRDYLFSASSIVSGNSITLTAGYAASSFEGGSTYDTIDASAVSLSSGGISITGNDNGNYIAIGKSGGSLFGGSGNDTLVGGDKEDIFRYTAGKDVIQNFGTGDSLTIDDTAIAKARSSSRRLTFTMTDKNNTLVFRSDDSIPAQISLTSGGYLTKDGVVKDDDGLKLFSSAKGRIDLNDTLYSAASIETANASDVKNQSVTLVGGSQGGTFIFATNNKKRDGFEYGGGSATITNYESGKDRINLLNESIAGFSIVNSDDVMISLSSSDSSKFISLNGAQGSEVLIHQSTNRGNSYSKMVFADTGVLYDKAKATSATLSTGASSFNVEEKDSVKSTLKKIIVGAGAQGISITAGNSKNTIIDASNASGAVSLISGAKNDKFTGSAYADTFVYKAGKDILQDFDATADQISLSGSDLDLTTAKITSGKKSIKFKFEGGSKNTLTIKPTKGDTLSGELTIDGDTRTYGKNSIADGGSVSLTSEFGGTYKVAGTVNNVDGHLVKKKLTIKGTTAAESLSGGSGKTMFKGGGGADSLVGGSGADTFFYAKGDKGSVTIANFDFNNDKLKIASGTLAKVSMTGSGVQFAMKEGRGTDAPEVGWFNVTTDAKDVLIKANNTYYWFAEGNETLASDDTLTANEGALVTSVNKISNSQVSGYSVIDLNYSTNLIKSEVAVQVKDTLKSNG